MDGNGTKSLGQIGEDLACEYLRDKGYRILNRNYRKPWGEIDIVTRAKDNTLVFAEVKTMVEAGDERIGPEDQMSAAKIEKFRRICRTFAAKNPELINERRGWRMDVVAIDANENINAKDWKIRHYENI